MKRYSLLGLMALMACGQSKDAPPFEKAQRLEFEIHGHRGARGLMPENSLEGFMLALSLGIDVLEMDVVVSADSQIVVSHEPWISAAICLDGDERPIAADKALDLNIYRMTYEEVKAYDCGSLPNTDFPLQQRLPVRKPLLSEVLSTVEAKRKELGLPPVRYSIETKCSPEGDGIYHPAPSDFVRLLLGTIDAAGVRNAAIIQSFDLRTLQQIHAIAPDVSTSLLLNDAATLDTALAILGFIPSILSPDHATLTEEVMSKAKQKGMRVIPYTVNEESEMLDLINLGVDGIITDYPDLAITLRQ
jgi:glycerophosphoryl diester phosphodiesterase